MARTFGGGLVCLACAAMAVGTALAQKPSAAQVGEIKTLYGQLTKTGPVPVEDGRKALDTTSQWKFDRAGLSAEQRGQLVACQVYASLAAGESRAAADYQAELQTERPDAAETQELGYAVALATGDAKLGAAAINKLIQSASATRKTELAEKLRQVKTIGVRAGAESVKAEDGTTVSIGERDGKVLILCLWNLRKKPDATQIAAMVRLHDAMKGGEKVEFLGVSANTATQVDEAKVFAAENKLNWKHHFEAKGAGAPITHKLFKAGSSPMQVVIDGDGVIRAIGEAGEAGIEYAARAAVAEADGSMTPPDSKSAEGKVANRAAAAKGGKTEEGSRGGAKKAAEKPGEKKPAEKKEAELRNDPEAESKLREARLAMRTGQKTRAKEILKEIVSNYPGTIQAKDAQERLESMP